MGHVLIHGDCNEVLKGVPSESIDLIITDPPYGINYESSHQNTNRRLGEGINTGKHYFDKIHNDDVVPVEWLEDAYRILKDGTAIYIFCHWQTYSYLLGEVSEYFKVKNMIVLNKSNHGMGDLKGSYAPKHELLLFATKGRHTFQEGLPRPKDVWDVPVKFSGARKYHPNEKPLSWFTNPIIYSSKEGDLILDPFMGSGSTGVAALSYGRHFVGVELDKKYFDIAQQRLGE